ncbi:zinc carboxypeptidase [Sabulilitoribacter multivorans]|uniref:Zinc carboxypeptidase n=1 Tax=Flaviramulus multivorans TaxID=1304750 RepID=A0ABS9II72_9FLAO|nr:M14 family zinc carboxypeptidase [Flaviramulus multivorans]MCF7560458.1 zinc carboxypeptidase [Flaviramulus multivorans]
MKHYILTLFVLCGCLLGAQNEFELSYHLPQNVTYNPEIPTPESIIGHNVGEWHVTHDKLVNYMTTLSKVSDRINIENRGETFEGRPILLLTVTSPENHANIENIRLNHLKLVETGSNSLNVDSMPIVVYQGFSIHGNEPSGSNASLLLAYYLAAAQGTQIDALLKNTVVLLDPSFNPDGLQRFASWVNANKSKNINPDPNDREYTEVWPKGRTNHYWFDLNRDWLPAQLPESRARINTYNAWMPNILTDHHEMATSSTFFFQPGIQSRVHPLTPKANQELTKEIGNYHAKALNKIGSLYFTEERYDDYYYGKGSTFPDINGAVGILFEQASSRGHAQESINGILTFPFTIRNQFTTALSTLEAANEMRVKLLNYQREFYNTVRNENAKSNIKGFVFGDEEDLAKTFHLAEILKRHDISLNKLNADITVDGKSFKKESSFVVSINQSKSKIIKAIFEKRTTFTDSLFYDISGWTYPLAFNTDYAELKSTSNTGELVQNLELNKGVVTSKSNYAYLMPWHEYYTPKALNAILNKGLRAKVGLNPFSLNNENFDYGTILIPVQNQSLNSDELFETLKNIAQNSHLKIFGVNTGLTEGIDLGSSSFKNIETPKVAMLVGNEVTSYDAGEIWHLFDQRYQMHLTKLDVLYLKGLDISKYTTIIIPSSKLKLDSETIDTLKDWVKNGGTLIGYKNTVKWLSSNKFIKLEYAKSEVKAKNISFEQKEDFKGAQTIGGSIFETEIDRSHPINFGYKNNKLAIFRDTEIFIKADSSSYNNPIKYSKNPLLSGYISKPNLEVLKETVPFQVKKSGKGKVIVFTDNTNFRAFWYGTNKLLMNAVFFSKYM